MVKTNKELLNLDVGTKSNSEILVQSEPNVKTAGDNKESTFSREELNQKIKNLRDDEMIVKMDDDGSLKVIKKNKYNLDSESKNKMNYTVVFGIGK